MTNPRNAQWMLEYTDLDGVKHTQRFTHGDGQSELLALIEERVELGKRVYGLTTSTYKPTPKSMAHSALAETLRVGYTVESRAFDTPRRATHYGPRTVASIDTSAVDWKNIPAAYYTPAPPKSDKLTVRYKVIETERYRAMLYDILKETTDNIDTTLRTATPNRSRIILDLRTREELRAREATRQRNALTDLLEREFYRPLVANRGVDTASTFTITTPNLITVTFTPPVEPKPRLNRQAYLKSRTFLALPSQRITTELPPTLLVGPPPKPKEVVIGGQRISMNGEGDILAD